MDNRRACQRLYMLISFGRDIQNYLGFIQDNMQFFAILEEYEFFPMLVCGGQHKVIVKKFYKDLEAYIMSTKSIRALRAFSQYKKYSFALHGIIVKSLTSGHNRMAKSAFRRLLKFTKERALVDEYVNITDSNTADYIEKKYAASLTK